MAISSNTGIKLSFNEQRAGRENSELEFHKWFFKFKLYCDRRSVGQFVWVSGPFWCPWPHFNFLCLTITFSLLHVGRPLWREDESVICSAITRLLEQRRTHNHILLSQLRLPQPGGPGLRIYIPQEQGGPVIPPGTGLPFRHLLRLARLRRRYVRGSLYLTHADSSILTLVGFMALRTKFVIILMKIGIRWCPPMIQCLRLRERGWGTNLTWI
jgi:hypothetical protein